ncbi:MAG: UDP-glucose 4-epimerase GalE [Verrucomicrobia bacterium]|nr:UDP-glucose 4-epimerase GalE [Verrucomicrobiota bacterium]
MKCLVTGGAGYIGSHVCKALKAAGHEPIVFDNLSNGRASAVKWGPLVVGDILDDEALDAVFREHQLEGVIHLAGLIEVRASIQQPEQYYEVNIGGTLELAKAMVRHGVRSLVFSSSAAVYGHPEMTPIREDHPKSPVSPYGHTKWMAEQILSDMARAHDLSVMSLRYFNAAGADLDGEIGEAHSPETHLIPLAILTALQKRPKFTINGDGSILRDFIHVKDLADAHVKALEWTMKNNGSAAVNLGTGQGCSVQEILDEVVRLTQADFPMERGPGSPLDPPVLVADSSLAKEMLGWIPAHSDLTTILETAWKWHRQ